MASFRRSSIPKKQARVTGGQPELALPAAVTPKTFRRLHRDVKAGNRRCGTPYATSIRPAETHPRRHRNREARSRSQCGLARTDLRCRSQEHRLHQGSEDALAWAHRSEFQRLASATAAQAARRRYLPSPCRFRAIKPVSKNPRRCAPRASRSDRNG